MKLKLLVLLAVTTFLTACSMVSGTVAPPEKRTFTRIIEVPNRSKNSLYVSANSWFVHTFDYAADVIEFVDKEEGRIIGKYIFDTFQTGVTFIIRQTIAVDVKDNKVRLTISNPYYKLMIEEGIDNEDFQDNEDCDYNENNLTEELFSPLVTENGLEVVRKEWEDLAHSLADYLKKDGEW